MEITGFSNFEEITSSSVDLFPCGIYVFVFKRQQKLTSTQNTNKQKLSHIWRKKVINKEKI